MYDVFLTRLQNPFRTFRNKNSRNKKTIKSKIRTEGNPHVFFTTFTNDTQFLDESGFRVFKRELRIVGH